MTFEYYPNAGGRDGAARSVNSSGIPQRSIEQDWGIFYQILPYLEQKGIFESAPDVAAAFRFKIYFCPTRRTPVAVSGSTANGLAATNQRGAIDYAGSGGEIGINKRGSTDPKDWEYISFAPAGPSYDRSLGWQNGAIIPRPNIVAGVFSERVTGQAISDGLSNVVMFGERNFNRKPIGAQYDEDNGYLNGWSLDTIRFGHMGRPKQDRPIPGEGAASTFDYRFGSSHSGIVLLAMCDGAVKSYRPSQQYSTDPAISEDQVFRQLVNRMDGKSPQLP